MNVVCAGAPTLEIMPITYTARVCVYVCITRLVDTRADEARRSIELVSGRLQKKWIPHVMELRFGSNDRFEHLDCASMCSSYIEGIRPTVIQRSNLSWFVKAVRVD